MTAKACVTLSSIWEQTTAVKISPERVFAHLEVRSPGRPVSLVDGDGWLAGVNPIGKNKWEILVWVQTLRSFAEKRPEHDIAQTAHKIFQAVAEVETGTWMRITPRPDSSALSYSSLG